MQHALLKRWRAAIQTIVDNCALRRVRTGLHWAALRYAALRLVSHSNAPTHNGRKGKGDVKRFGLGARAHMCVRGWIYACKRAWVNSMR
jgi:hypothetical protein